MTNEPALARQFSRCLPFYTAGVENVSPYNRPGWEPIQNATIFYSDFDLEKECPRPWRYRGPENLRLRPFKGVMATFVGGGYIADLGYNSHSALKVINMLEKDIWIDDQTVAVFTEFTIFEPSSSLFSTIKLLFERSPTGGSHGTVAIKTLSLYASQDPNSRSLFQICQLLLMIILVVFIFAEIGKLRREKCSYFKQIWNWLDLLQISSTICSLVFFFLKESRTSKFVKEIQENPFKTSSTDNIVYMSDIETYLLSFVIFIVTIKFLRLIKFNRHVCQVLGTLQRAAAKVLSFMIVFVTIILAYTQVGFLVFSSDVSSYSSFYCSFRAMLLLLFGGEMHFHDLQSTSRYVAPAFLFGYLSTMAMVLLNMFLAIFNDSYHEINNVDPGEAFADAELGAFMVDYTKHKINQFKDETWELVECTVSRFISFFQNDKRQNNEEDSESLSDKPKLASFDSINGFGSDYNDDDTDTYPLLKFSSLSSMDEYDTMSLTDLKEKIMQIATEIRQSMTSLKSASSRKSLYQESTAYDFKTALSRLEEDDDSLRYHEPTSYFAALGSYLEDIWQKNRGSFQDLTKGRLHKQGDESSKNIDENENLLTTCQDV